MGAFDSILGEAATSRKRRVFFSFHYADIMRVNNVRMCGEFKTTPTPSDAFGATGRSIEGFYDFSLWEKRKLDGTDALKRMIREGVENTSAICVLIGSQTYLREWVRYEIARSVVDQRGLFGVHLNNINHHTERRPHLLGANPLDYMGIYKAQVGVSSATSYYLAEKASNGEWVRYANYTPAVPKPAYLPEPSGNFVIPLSRGTRLYDFVNETGHRNIGSWIDQAAQSVGR